MEFTPAITPVSEAAHLVATLLSKQITTEPIPKVQVAYFAYKLTPCCRLGVTGVMCVEKPSLYGRRNSTPANKTDHKCGRRVLFDVSDNGERLGGGFSSNVAEPN